MQQIQYHSSTLKPLKTEHKHRDQEKRGKNMIVECNSQEKQSYKKEMVFIDRNYIKMNYINQKYKQIETKRQNETQTIRQKGKNPKKQTKEGFK